MPESIARDTSLRQARQAAVRRLLARINYETRDALPYKGRGLKLERMRELLDRIDHPERDLEVVHIAGTKGKGSTAAMIASILERSGLRTGLYMSPHLDRLEQRFVVHGQPCSTVELIELVNRIWPAVEAMDAAAARSQQPARGPTYFEITTAMAFLHFQAANVDAAVLEVGLGGRLDSTNVCLPRITAITSISLDHTQQLGDTLAEIAWEKAGIVKPGIPVVSGVTAAEPRRVIEEVAEQRGCRLLERGRDFEVDCRPLDHERHGESGSEITWREGTLDSGQRLDGLPIPLLGQHQADNAGVAVTIASELQRQGWPITATTIREGLARVRLPARVEVVRRQPTVVVDTAHNVASVQALVETLRTHFPRAGSRWTLLAAMTSDKDTLGMLAELAATFDRFALTQYCNNPRSVAPLELANLLGQFTDRPCSVHSTPEEAWQSLAPSLQPNELICVTGSFYLAAELRQLIQAL